MEKFFGLVQMALGHQNSLPVVPASRDEWEELYAAVGKHNLLGVTFPAIDALHDTVDVPLGVYSRWAMATEKIEARNRYQRESCAKLYKGFMDHGFRSCVLKGQAAGALYPDPALRQGGDIDIWVEGERQTIVDFLRASFSVQKVVYHHCDVKMIKGIGVEVHFTPSWMNAFCANKRLQRWFSSHSDEQFSNFSESLGFSVPTLHFNAVYFLIHIYRHVLEEGIGLRQLLDYYYLLEHLSDTDRAAVLEDLKYLKLRKFAAAVMYVLKEVFMLDDSCLLMPPDPALGSFLLDEILQSGNFGKDDPRNAHKKGEGIIAHTLRKLRRNLRFLFYFPSEVISMPLFMCWQYFWRRKHAYLYKGR